MTSMGGGFDPSYDMAESWRRLRSGIEIQKHDLTLVLHEAEERELMGGGMPYEEAHRITCEEFGYNYPEELSAWKDRNDLW